MIFPRSYKKYYGSFLVIAILFFGCSPPPPDNEKPKVSNTQTAEIAVPTIADQGPRPRIGNAKDRMAEPVMPAGPSQPDLGTLDYWLNCMACHGDKAQGLTDEWRAAWGPEEMNCWQSKCHASNHPEEGFVFPKFAPNLVRPDSLNRFITAQDYFDYISIEMPWWNPGSLEEVEYWRLTAYLLRENGVEIIGDLNTDNAASIILGQKQELKPLP